MKKYLFVLSVLSILFVSNFNIVFANCSSYGGSTTCTDEKDYDLQKRVKESDSDKKEQKITGIKKGENFIFVFKVENYKNKIKLFYNLLFLVFNLEKIYEKLNKSEFNKEFKNINLS